MDIGHLKSMDLKSMAMAVGLVYMGLVYFLPPKVAKKIEPLGKFLQFLAGTPGGVKRK